jgi:hypothetical protein
MELAGGEDLGTVCPWPVLWMKRSLARQIIDGVSTSKRIVHRDLKLNIVRKDALMGFTRSVCKGAGDAAGGSFPVALHR